MSIFYLSVDICLPGFYLAVYLSVGRSERELNNLSAKESLYARLEGRPSTVRPK